MLGSLQKQKVGSQVHLGQSLRQKKRVRPALPTGAAGYQGSFQASREEELSTSLVSCELSSTEH